MKRDSKDPILDGALEEVLGGRTPPDLTARIMQAWAARRTENETGAGVQRAVDQARSAAQLPPAAVGVGLNVPIPVNGNGQYAARPRESTLAVETKRRKKFPWEAVVAVSSVAIVAGLLAATVLPQLNQPKVAQPHNNPTKNGTKLVDKPQPSPVHPTKPIDPNKPNVEVSPPAVVNTDKPNVDKPSRFPTPVPEETPKPQVVDNTPPARATIEPIPAKQLIQFVNLELSQSWKDNKVTPAAPASDSEWCRRVYVRLLGRIPAVEEITAFTKDSSADRREKLVTQLLESEKYADEFNQHWAGVWINVLVGRVAGMEEGDPVNREQLQGYLVSAFDRKLSYDRLVTELLIAQGSTGSANVQEGAINFLLSGFQEKDATVATNRVSRIFLGVNLQCAQCHNHPTNDWDQADYWSLNAFLRQIAVERDGKNARLYDRDLVAQRGDADEAEVYYQTPSGLMKVAYPKFIDGTELPHTGDLAQVNRREKLAQLIVRTDEMPRALVNRMWSHFFGYGFTKPVDDIGEGNQPTHPELLEKLSQQFIAHGYDLRALMKWIVLSDPFQRSSRIPAGNIADSPEAGNVALFSRYYTRQLQVEEVYDSLMIAAKFRSNTADGVDPVQARKAWSQQFARSMATDDMSEESTFDGGTRQSIIMMTGDLMQHVTSSEKDGMLRGVIASPLTYEEKVQHLFLAALSRRPAAKEMQGAQKLLAANGNNAKSALQDLWWALLNSNEFILDH